MTAIADASLWCDFGARLLGMGRSFVAARGSGLRGLAVALVDGDDAAIRLGDTVHRSPDSPDVEVYTPKVTAKKRRRRSSKGWTGNATTQDDTPGTPRR
jgi:hypothetical protein